MKIVIITGQTATGKTKLALDYAAKNRGVLINCDSRQIYKYLDIITGKDKHLFKSIQINLIDLIEPDRYFSSYDFVNLAVPLIKKILSQGKTPILVGGSYLYLKHLLYRVETENIPPDFRLRRQLKNKSVVDLQNTLKKLNISYYRTLNNSDINNPQRLIRKIEIYSHASIKRLASLKRQRRGLIEAGSNSKNCFDFNLEKKLGINSLRIELIGLKFKDKKKLQTIIKKRVEQRMKTGAIKEVVKLLKKGYRETDPGLKTIGYSQLVRFLNGSISLDAAVGDWINKEVQYAKRQLTFMKKDPHIKWRIL